MSDEQRRETTTDAGNPATSDEFSLTVGPGGPIALHDHYAVQKMQHFNRERVPERVVHAKGGGAHGFFEVTEDLTQYTKADFLQPGKRTDTFLRFSTVAGEQGSPTHGAALTASRWSSTPARATTTWWAITCSGTSGRSTRSRLTRSRCAPARSRLKWAIWFRKCTSCSRIDRRRRG